MKQTIKVAAVFFVTVIFAFIPLKHDITGRWITYNKDGSIAYVDFSKNGTFKVASPDGQLFHAGNYKFSNDDVFSINDKEGCGDTYWGKYKLTFISEDSLQIAVIEDSCTGRREDITTGNTGLKRFKK
jgi:hypothetical protein